MPKDPGYQTASKLRGKERKKQGGQKGALLDFIRTIKELQKEASKVTVKKKKAEKVKSIPIPNKKSKDNLATEDKKRQLRRSLREEDINRFQRRKK